MHHVFTNSKLYDDDIKHDYKVYLYEFLYLKWRFDSLIEAVKKLNYVISLFNVRLNSSQLVSITWSFSTTIKTCCTLFWVTYSVDSTLLLSWLETMKENMPTKDKSTILSLTIKLLLAETMNKLTSSGWFLWEECNSKLNTIFSHKFHSTDFPMPFQSLRKNLPNLENLLSMVQSLEKTEKLIKALFYLFKSLNICYKSIIWIQKDKIIFFSFNFFIDEKNINNKSFHCYFTLIDFFYLLLMFI